MRMIIFVQLLQISLPFARTSHCNSDSSCLSTRVGKNLQYQISESSSSESNSDTDSASSYSKIRRKCKCSCSKCYKPIKCCLELCNSCIPTQPGVIVVPYPVPFIITQMATRKKTKPPRKTTASVTESPKTTTDTTSSATETTSDTTFSATETTSYETPAETETTKKTVLSSSTLPPTAVQVNPSEAWYKRCPNVNCIPRNWDRMAALRNGHQFVRPTLGIRTKYLFRTKRIIEVPPQYAEKFLQQIEKLKEIPKDERSINIQQIEMENI